MNRSRFADLTLVVATVIAGIGLFGLGSVSQAVPIAPGNVSSGLVLWLDASDPAANGAAPANGTTITTWEDKSPANNDATVNPNGAIQPHTAAVFESAPTGFNGKSALRFTRIDNDSGSVYKVAGLDIRASVKPDVTVFSVYKPVTRTANNGLWGDDDGAWDRFFIPYHPGFGDGVDDGVVGLGPVTGGATILNAAATAAPSMFAIGYDGNVVGGTNSGVTNGSYVYFDCTLLRNFTDSTHATQARDHFSVGWDGDDNVFDGYVAEMIVYDRTLTTQEISDINGYLASKYSLPTGCASFATTTTTTTTVATAPVVVTTSTSTTSPPETTTTVPPTTTTRVVQPRGLGEGGQRLPETGAEGKPDALSSLMLVSLGVLLLLVSVRHRRT